MNGSTASFATTGSVSVVGASLTTRHGALLTLPTLRSYQDGSACCGALLEASGAGRRLDLSAVTNLTGDATWTMTVRAQSDGSVQPVSILWLENTPLFGAIYPGTFGHTYGFYSVAVDQSGNSEAAPFAADATTLVNRTSSAPGLTVGMKVTVAEGLSVVNSAGTLLTNGLGPAGRGVVIGVAPLLEAFNTPPRDRGVLREGSLIARHQPCPD